MQKQNSGKVQVNNLGKQPLFFSFAEKEKRTMSTRFVFIIAFLASAITMNGQAGQKEYLRKVLGNLEKIESASFYTFSQSWMPGDTIPSTTNEKFYKEYNNPKDTTIGASFVALNKADTTLLEWGYNGEIKAMTRHDEKGIMIDDFTARKLPFRPVGAPFFNYTKSIIKYALETQDSIDTDLNKFGDHYLFRLTIHEDTQVEFFGKAVHMPLPPFDPGDPTSIYELWISKADGLPYKYRREMSHQISATTCSGVALNRMSINDFDLYAYFPKDYEIRRYGEKRNEKPKSDLIGKPVPDWTLNDITGQPVALANLKSKVLLINLTGLSCGACHAAIPFLNSLKDRFGSEDFELVAIETWKGKQHSLQNYVTRYKINYKLLEGTDKVVEDYQTGRAAPFFIIVDKNRMVRKVLRGYSLGKTDKEITDGIEELLQE